MDYEQICENVFICYARNGWMYFSILIDFACFCLLFLTCSNERNDRANFSKNIGFAKKKQAKAKIHPTISCSKASEKKQAKASKNK